MGRGERETKAVDGARGLLYGPRPVGPGPAEIPSPVDRDPADDPAVEEERELPPSVQASRNLLPIDKLKQKGIETLVINYNGYGDSGQVDYFETQPTKVDLTGAEQQPIENFAYDLLGALHGGWEINEGSNGTITLDLVNNTIKHDHWENIISQNHIVDDMTL